LSVEILGGVVNASGGLKSTAIGSAVTREGNSSIGMFSITGGLLTAIAGDSPVALGGESAPVTLGPSSTEVTIDCYAGVSCVSGDGLVVTNTNVVAFTNASTFWGRRAVFGSATMFTQYRGRSEPELVSGTAMIHFGTLMIEGAAVGLTFTGQNRVRTATFIGRSMQGFALSLPSPGEYEIEVAIDGREAGRICVGEQTVFVLLDGDNFFENATVCAKAATPGGSGDGERKQNALLVIVVMLVLAISVITIGVVCLVAIKRKRVNEQFEHPLVSDPTNEVFVP
jgi:hypothetical protein